MEFHTWGAKADNIGKPDRIIFDLDPGAGIHFNKISECAEIINEILKGLDLQAFVKTSGKKGLHVCLPIIRNKTWEGVKAFTKTVAEQLEKFAPQYFTTNIKKESRKNKIFIDYLRNERGATCIAALSTRITNMANISTPLTWEELSAISSSSFYHINNIDHRLNSLKEDPWKDYFKIRQHLPVLSLS